MKKLILIISIISVALTSITFAQPSDIASLTDGWLRVAPNKIGGGFFEITNLTKNDLYLIGIKAKGAKRIEMHNHSMKDGVMSMHKVDKVTIPANAALSFNPHGYHLMLFKLDKTIFSVGNEVQLTFVFENAAEQDFTFIVHKFGKMKKM